MRAAAILLILATLLPIHPAGADVPSQPAAFRTILVADVFATALAFISPRTLDPVSIPQLTLWGLHGLTAIDPQLATDQQDNTLRLLWNGQVLAVRAIPPADNADAWGEAVAQLALAAWAASATVQHVGTQGVIRSFFDELFNHLDRYSRYAPPEEAAQDRARRSGEAGAGLILARQGEWVVVRDVIAEGPGDSSGVRVGERIVAVDGQQTQGQSGIVVDGWIRGAVDSVVTITLRGRDGRLRMVSLTRALVPPETVFASRVKDMLVLRITGFSRSTASRLAAELAQGLAEGAGHGRHRTVPYQPLGVVLDLRGNRGGLVRQAVEAANLLLDAGIVVVTAGRHPAASHVWLSTDGMLAADLPVVVVVDGLSASAAEIMAAALADRGRAVVVGSATLGKGVVQTISPLPDGGDLLVTWSRLLAPRGWPLQGLGVLPQLCTSLGDDVLRQQWAALQQGEAPMRAAIERERQSRVPVSQAESLEIRAACPAAIGSDRDLQVAQRLVESPIAYAAALLPPLPKPLEPTFPQAALP